jgi:superfamily II DNA or RNA helicase
VSENGLHIGSVIDGLALPEPLQVVLVQPVGASFKVGGKGTRTGQYIERIFDMVQIEQLTVLAAEEPFDGDAARFRLGIEAYRLGLAHEYDPYFSLSVARVDPLPHQLEAVYDAILPLPRIRFLLADDPGAGKTIMAGLLLKELKARGLAARTLIVTPANLAFQWKRELSDKFRETFEVIRGADLRTAYGTNPWLDRHQVITSIDWAKRDEVRESLGRATWDLVIVDEAHKMSAAAADKKSDRYRLGEILSQKTDHYLLLTATPHKGDPENFTLFLQLLDKDVYAEVASLQEAIRQKRAPFYLRRTKEALYTFPNPETGEVHKIFTKRDVKTARFDLDGDEFNLYLALTRYVEDQSIKASGDQSARGRALGFTMAMMQRRFASSVRALRRTLERRRDRLQKQLDKPAKLPDFNEQMLDDLDDLPEDEAERLYDNIELVSLSQERRLIKEEIAELDRLILQAQILEQREVESKLTRLKDLISEQGLVRDPSTKLLIFTEHKDTLDYLVEKLRTWGLTVTQIHGGMKVGDRDTPGTRVYAEREFREDAQVMVATEAAGEGINLQFCWLMVNYDMPWNPSRLEQRMGRIHRYGQEHNCLIFNFLAANTREGMVLDRLFDRLKEIRNELGTDQVFDVIGDIFPSNQLEKMFRELYAGNTTQQALLDRIVHDLDLERFRRICQSTLESLTQRQLVNLTAIVGKRAEARERRMVPEVVRDFFIQAAPLAGLSQFKPKELVMSVGRLPREMLTVGERLASQYGPLGREYKLVTFERSATLDQPGIEWITPGHPLFEVVREMVWDIAQPDLRQGAVFYDVKREKPARLDLFAVSVKDGRGITLNRRIFVVEATSEGAMEMREPTILLDLNPAPVGVPIPPQDSLPDRERVEAHLLETALQPFLTDMSAQRAGEVDRIRRHVELSLNTLIDRQQRQIAEFYERDEPGIAGNIAQAEARLDELNRRLETRLKLLDRERQFSLGELTHLGRAWILPHPEREQFKGMVPDPEIEMIGMRVAMDYERAQGWEPEDVSAQNRGFDVLSRHPATGGTRFIEVKGRAEEGSIVLTPNEHATARRLGKDYWLYVAFNCATTPQLIRIPDPAQLEWKPVTKIEYYMVAPGTIRASNQSNSS